MFKFLKSRTTWTVIVMFLVGGIEAISSYFSPAVLTLLEGLLGAAAIYFRVDQRVDFTE